ncbi:MAG: hypothetical protein JWP36_2763 [Paucimonas sp.]|jgi:hypothetical protein|nr:hypothetical protein [Paucimonas sp.]
MQSVPDKKNILVAVAHDSVEKMTALMGDSWQLYWPRTLQQAQLLLSKTRMDAIVCGARFDDSRLLDLLQFCKSQPAYAGIPFLCLRLMRGRLPLDMFRDLSLASAALGASGFFDYPEAEEQLGTALATARYRQVIADLMNAER